ncbi:MAG TPA: signal recognition particle-docking protein FtsY [Actinomycetota bacterium]|nr:signal recognition particle-docking protein FtsY [Actinomycetota bacterium]
MNEVVLAAIVLALLIVLLVARARRPTERDFQALDTRIAGEDVVDDELADEDLIAELEADLALEEAVEEALEEVQVPEAPPAPVVAPPSRWARGLAKTRGALGNTLKALGLRDKLDSDAWDEIEEALIRADVGVDATERVLEALREEDPSPDQLHAALRRELVEILEAGDRTLHTKDGEPSVWLVTGVNGVGKTTSIAKLGRRLKEDGRTVVLAAGDTFRAAAIEQLGTWAERLGVHMVKHAPGADPGAVVFDAIEHAKAKDVDVVIVDTAGRLQTKTNLMEELKKVRRIADREAGGVAEVLLVLDATVGQNGLSQAKAFQEAVGATGVILTKLDGTAKGGIVIAIQDKLGIPVKAVGVGEGIDDMEEFDPEAFVEAMLA